jgi:putative ABC transport system permease protein
MCYRGGVYLEFEPTHAVHHLVSPDSFAAHDMPVLSGRVFTAADTLGAARVAVINRAMALRHFQPGDPVGRALYLSDGFPGTPYTVVGVVDDGAPESFGAAYQRHERVYLSVLQHPPAQAQLLLRTPGGERPRVLERVADVVARGGARTGPTRDERDVLAAAVAPGRWLGRWMLGGGLVLVLLAGLGLATTVRLWVASLQAELGLRRAVGATRGAVLRHVAWRALLAGVAGLVVAVLLLFTVAAPIVETSLRGVRLWQPRLFAVSGVVLLVVAMGSALVPAARIARTAPARLFD